MQIRRLRPGDRVGVGRSMLLFGPRRRSPPAQAAAAPAPAPVNADGPPCRPRSGQTLAGRSADDADFELPDPADECTADGPLFPARMPPLPQKLTPSQAARLAEISTSCTAG